MLVLTCFCITLQISIFLYPIFLGGSGQPFMVSVVNNDKTFQDAGNYISETCKRSSGNNGVSVVLLRPCRVCLYIVHFHVSRGYSVGNFHLFIDISETTTRSHD